MSNETKFKINIPIDQLMGGRLSKSLTMNFEKSLKIFMTLTLRQTSSVRYQLSFHLHPMKKKKSMSWSEFPDQASGCRRCDNWLITDKDLRTNTIMAEEFKAGSKGQTYIDENGQLRNWW